MYEEGLLAFDPVAPGWQWDMDRIRARGYTDNVVDLMVEKLKRLSASTQEALKQLACLGNIAEIAILALVQRDTEEAIHTALWEAVHAGLVLREDSAYKFLHDRIQQAAYSLILDEHRADIHLRIGRAMLASMSAGVLAEHLFDVANQLNRGAGRLIDRDEKVQAATINLRAGRRAKASAAYASACVYLTAGMAALDDGDWGSQYELMFSLWLERAECAFLTGDFDQAERLIAQLLQRGASKFDLAAVYRLKVLLHTVKSDSPQALGSALTCLHLFGVDLPAHPTWEQVQLEYETIWQNLDGRPIENLIDLPLMADPEMQAVTDMLSAMLPATYYTNLNLYYLLACRIVNVSMEYGVNGASANAYAFCGLNIVGSVYHRYRESFRFAKLAFDLVEKHGFLAYRAKVLLAMGMASFWSQPITTAINFMRAAYRDAVETGDLIFVCFSVYQIVAGLFLRNDPLDAVWRELEMALDFARQAKYGDVLDIIVSQQRFIANMQGRTATFSTFSDAQFDEAAFEAQMMVGRTSTMICWYWILKLKARFLSCDYGAALVAADKVRALLWASATSIHLLDYYYYAALAVAAHYEKASADKQTGWRELLIVHREQLREWAENYPPTFGDKHALVSAEIARLEGRDADAMRLYEQAIQSARKHGFVQNEGVAYEVAAQFYEARGVDSIAHAYLRNARYGYLRWGADGKVRQLDRLHPHLSAAGGVVRRPSLARTVQQLDVASIVKASQALSSEIELPKLIERLMTNALENAGADRGLLVLPAGEDYVIQAQGQTIGDQVEVVLGQTPITRLMCPNSLLRYVIRTRESVIIGDASRPNPFSEDDYLRSRQPKSILCLPLIKQGRLTGLLYLENTLTSHAFTPDRITVLELLAAQAAISLENTRLYSDLQEREGKVRRLVNSNIIGVYIWDFQGRIIDANEAFLDMVGYSREDLISGSLSYPGLTPSEWNDVSERARASVKTTGTSYVFEKEYLRKDGSRVPILLGGTTFGEGQEQGVAFVLDLTERKRAEENLRESERRYREAQAELAHVNRVTTMGQLTASIAHEVSQPIHAVAINAQAASLWLAAQPPDLEEVGKILARIVESSNRAGDVIGRIRALVKKAPQRKDRLEINGAIREVIELTRGETEKNRVSVRTQLADDLPLVQGDRVQLQQVILNLIVNAVQAMSGVGDGARELLISTGTAELDGVLVTVRDTGPGLPPSSLERLFDAFYTTKADGMGMGLSICRSIIEAHGGRLWASENLPRGAVFQFTAPPYASEGS